MILVSAGWCTNCKPVKKYMEERGFDYDLLDADEQVEYVRSMGIRGIPTLIDGDKLLTGVETIKNYLEER